MIKSDPLSANGVFSRSTVALRRAVEKLVLGIERSGGRVVAVHIDGFDWPPSAPPSSGERETTDQTFLPTERRP